MRRVLKLDGYVDVVVELFYPEIDQKTDGHYECCYTITGLSKTLHGSAMGVDAIQALYLALQLIGNRLYTIIEFKTGRLSWPFSVDVNDLGFPTAV
jgi:hypothetical protein